jgi:hypothetical protein
MKAGAGPFRPIEEWKSALMTLPDSNFFELLRNVFGNIKTPFNKQRLMNDLTALLSREDIRRTIEDYIDEGDRKVIAAVALLCDPAPGELESFFSGDLAYAELHNILLNLEERLIIYRFSEENIRRLALNPVLEPVLAPIAAGKEILFPSWPDAPETGKSGKNQNSGTARLEDGRALAGLLSFVCEDEEFFKAEGGIRKKFIDGGKKLFPGLDMETAAEALVRMGLIRADGERLVPDEERINAFGRLSAGNGREYWAAAVYLALNRNEYPEPGSSGFSRNRLREIASFIHRFCGFIEPGRRYPKITLKRFAELLNHDEGGGWGSRFVEGPLRLPFDPLLECLEKTGLLEETGEAGSFRGGVFPGVETREGQALIAMNSTFSFVLYPGISFADAAALSAFCTVTGIRGSVFELTRASAVRGFDRGLGSAYITDLLNRLSAGRMDANLGWTLKDWESRYSSVSLHEGVVLTLAEDRRYLAEAGPVASLIKKTLAPGVYLLGGGLKAEAVLALKKSGVDIVACPELRDPAPRREILFRLPSRVFPPLGGGMSPADFVKSAGKSLPDSQSRPDASDSIKERFRRRLKELRLSGGEHEELSARIERRLVLSEAQLEGASVHYEKLEARGLDYVGKAAIAKQAIAAGAMVEVSWPNPGGGTNTAAGIPSALEKKQGESVLVIKPVEQDGVKAELRLPLGKISLLRQIKQSIFGEN